MQHQTAQVYRQAEEIQQQNARSRQLLASRTLLARTASTSSSSGIHVQPAGGEVCSPPTSSAGVRVCFSSASAGRTVVEDAWACVVISREIRLRDPVLCPLLKRRVAAAHAVRFGPLIHRIVIGTTIKCGEVLVMQEWNQFQKMNKTTKMISNLGTIKVDHYQTWMIVNQTKVKIQMKLM